MLPGPTTTQRQPNDILGIQTVTTPTIPTFRTSLPGEMVSLLARLNMLANCVVLVPRTMKIILTGSTGFIGREVIEQCIQNPSITSIVALSRRELPESLAASPKVNVVIVDDYMAYTPSTLEAVHGADACIWYVLPPHPSPPRA